MIEYDFDLKLSDFDSKILDLTDYLHNNSSSLLEKLNSDYAPITPPRDLTRTALITWKKCVEINNYTIFINDCPRYLRYLSVPSFYQQLITRANINEIEAYLNIVNQFPKRYIIYQLTVFCFQHHWKLKKNKVLGITVKLIQDMGNEIDINHKTISAINNNMIPIVLDISDSITLKKFKKINSVLCTEMIYGEYTFQLILIALNSKISLNEDVQELIINYLNLINNSQIKLVIISKWINNNYGKNIELLKRLAMKHIGDPTKRNLWNVLNDYSEFRNEVILARNILKKWINKQFISAFFETMDARDRGDFWKKHVNKMQEVLIMGSNDFLEQMRNKVPSASSYLGERYKITNGREACALIYFSKHVIVLYNIAGRAAICRKIDDPLIPSIRSNRPVTDYIQGDFHLAFNQTAGKLSNVNEDGRMIHHSNWDIAFDEYLNKIVL